MLFGVIYRVSQKEWTNLEKNTWMLFFWQFDPMFDTPLESYGYLWSVQGFKCQSRSSLPSSGRQNVKLVTPKLVDLSRRRQFWIGFWHHIMEIEAVLDSTGPELQNKTTLGISDRMRTVRNLRNAIRFVICEFSKSC